MNVRQRGGVGEVGELGLRGWQIVPASRTAGIGFASWHRLNEGAGNRRCCAGWRGERVSRRAGLPCHRHPPTTIQGYIDEYGPVSRLLRRPTTAKLGTDCSSCPVYMQSRWSALPFPYLQSSALAVTPPPPTCCGMFLLCVIHDHWLGAEQTTTLQAHFCAQTRGVQILSQGSGTPV